MFGRRHERARGLTFGGFEDHGTESGHFAFFAQDEAQAHAGTFHRFRWIRMSRPGASVISCACTATHGQVAESLELNENRFRGSHWSWSSQTTTMWARANGCRWNEETCYAAAGEGHLEALQWGTSRRPHGPKPTLTAGKLASSSPPTCRLVTSTRQECGIFKFSFREW